MKLSCQILGHFVQSDHKPINIIFSLRHWMFTLMNCNRLNVCVPSNSCWSPNSLWWCLEVIRLRWGQEGGAPMNGISALLRGGRGQSPLFPSMWGHRKKAAFCRSALPRGRISGHLNSDCQPPELWERNAYCLSALPPPPRPLGSVPFCYSSPRWLRQGPYLQKNIHTLTFHKAKFGNVISRKLMILVFSSILNTKLCKDKKWKANKQTKSTSLPHCCVSRFASFLLTQTLWVPELGSDAKSPCKTQCTFTGVEL